MSNTSEDDVTLIHEPEPRTEAGKRLYLAAKNSLVLIGEPLGWTMTQFTDAILAIEAEVRQESAAVIERLQTSLENKQHRLLDYETRLDAAQAEAHAVPGLPSGLDWLLIFDRAAGGTGSGHHGQDRFGFNARVDAILAALPSPTPAEPTDAGHFPGCPFWPDKEGDGRCGCAGITSKPAAPTPAGEGLDGPREALEFIADWAHECHETNESDVETLPVRMFGFDKIEARARAALLSEKERGPR